MDLVLVIVTSFYLLALLYREYAVYMTLLLFSILWIAVIRLHDYL